MIGGAASPGALDASEMIRPGAASSRGCETSVVGEPRSESVRRRPDPRLRSVVGWYSGYVQEGVPPGSHRGLPSPWLTLIFTLDDPLELAVHPDPLQAPGRYDTLLGGLHTRPALIVHRGRQSGVQVALDPLAARALLGCPAGALADSDLRADEVLGRAAGELRERLAEAPTWDARLPILDEGLLELLVRRRGERTVEPPSTVLDAWRAIGAAQGRLAIGELAHEVGWSDRQLRKRFRAETGLTPKAAARVVRFDRARRRLAGRLVSGRPADLADLAAECGYADQAHLSREFAVLAGCPPARWAAEEFRNIQAGAHLQPPS